MNEFLIAIHRDLTSKNPSPSLELMKGALKPYQDWIGSIAAQNKLVATPKRWDVDGRFVKKDNSVIHGPYTENNISIGGLFLIKANDYDEAIEIAKECPIIKFGATVEVRMAIPTA
ncbi:MAG: transcription initiation protein [Marivirga sp.]|nr:transcription initiation protein [Marivirga sp.]